MFFINTVIGHLWHLIPGAHYKRMYGEDFDGHTYGLIDSTRTITTLTPARAGPHRGGRPAGAIHWGWARAFGAAVLSGRQLARAISQYLADGEFSRRRLNNELVERSGSGYTARHGEDIFKTEDIWFRGLDLIAGPDGGVFVSDWSDVGECHNADGVHRTSAGFTS